MGPDCDSSLEASSGGGSESPASLGVAVQVVKPNEKNMSMTLILICQKMKICSWITCLQTFKLQPKQNLKRMESQNRPLKRPPNQTLERRLPKRLEIHFLLRMRPPMSCHSQAPTTLTLTPLPRMRWWSKSSWPRGWA